MSRETPTYAASGAPGIVGQLPFPVLRSIFEFLTWRDWVRFRCVASYFEAALGQLVTEVNLPREVFSVHVVDDSERTVANSEPSASSKPRWVPPKRVFNSRPFLVFRRVRKLCVSLPGTEYAGLSETWLEMKALMEFFLSQDTLRHLQVNTQDKAHSQLVLELLPLCCDRLEGLDLDFQSVPPILCWQHDLVLDPQVTAGCVERCRFGCLKVLKLGGAALGCGQPEAPLGLLTFFDKHPEAFLQLQDVTIVWPPTEVYVHLAVMGLGLARLKAAGPSGNMRRLYILSKHMEDDEALGVAVLALGALLSSPLERLVLKCTWALNGMCTELAARCLGPTVSHLTIFVGVAGPLVEAMREGRLCGLRHLGLLFSKENIPTVQEVLTCLKQDHALCPHLTSLELEASLGVQDLAPGLWGEGSWLGRRITRLTLCGKLQDQDLEYFISILPQFPDLKRVDIRRAWVRDKDDVRIREALLLASGRQVRVESEHQPKTA